MRQQYQLAKYHIPLHVGHFVTVKQLQLWCDARPH